MAGTTGAPETTIVNPGIPSWLYHPEYGAGLLDSTWVRQTFMMAAKNSDPAQQAWRYSTYASIKFADTRLGGNKTINNIPQYTRFADIRNNGINPDNSPQDELSNVGGRLGMGRFYSEQIDDNSQVIHMGFGVAEYNGMISFFTGFFDNEASILANEGRGSISYYLGLAAGIVVSLPLFPYILAGSVARFLLQKPTSKYYYLRRAHGPFWNRVNLIANTIAVNMGLVPRVLGSTNSFVVGEAQNKLGTGGATTAQQKQYPAGTKLGDVDDKGNPLDEDGTAGDDSNFIAYAHRMAPDIFEANGQVNIYAVANKYQRMADAYYKSIRNLVESEAGSDNESGLLSKLEAFIGFGSDNNPAKITPTPSAYPTFKDYVAAYHASALGDTSHTRKDATQAALSQDISQTQAEQPPATGGSPSSDPNASTAQGDALASQFQQTLRSKYKVDPNDPNKQIADSGYGNDDSMFKYMKANAEDGSDFVSFRVDYTGPIQESFSNSVGESGISGKINGMVASAREARFDFSDGNTGINPLDSVLGAARNLVSGLLDGVHMGGLLSLGGAAFVDIPKHWTGSSTSFPTQSFSMQLRSPYGNKLSRFINMYVPLSILLAAALPISTGKRSYTSPFLCEMYSRGRQTIRLGMIESLSITRGAGNMGWDRDGNALGIDITFNVADLSSIMHIPIDTGFDLTAPWKGAIDDDNPFLDYMASLGGLDMADQIYSWRRTQLALTRKRSQIDTFFSKAHFANAGNSYWPTRMAGSVWGAFIRVAESSASTQ